MGNYCCDVKYRNNLENTNSHCSYHKDDRDEQELRCSKLKSRAQAVETASTCSYKQAQSPATMMLRTPKKDNSAVKDTRNRRPGSKLSPRAKLGKFSPGAKGRRYSPGWKSPRKAKRKMVHPTKAAAQKVVENTRPRDLGE